MSSTNASGGIGFGGVLFIVFLILKLTGNITWPWIWVFAPLWIPFVIVMGIIFVAFIFGLIATIFS